MGRVGGVFTAQTSGGSSQRRFHSSRLVQHGRFREERRRSRGGNRVIHGLKMTMSVPERKSGSEGKEEESEDESEILEESPCGRWQKRKEQVGVCVCLRERDLFLQFQAL